MKNRIFTSILSMALILSVFSMVGLTTSAETNGDYTYKILADGTASIDKYAVDNEFEFVEIDESILYGDVNGDGNVNAIDVLMIKKYIVGLIKVL